MKSTETNLKRWEALRRSLRLCHDAIDANLNELHDINRLASSVTSRQPRGPHSQSIVTDDIESQSTKTTDVAKAIRDNIRQANNITDDMVALCFGDSVKTAQLQRLEAVTANYHKEFEQTLGNIHQNLDRKRLFLDHKHSSNIIGQQYDEQHLLLQERRAAESSMTMLEQALATGREAFASLGRQRKRLEDTGGMLHQFTHKIPYIRNVMSHIQRVKLKQAIILAIVVGLCLLFMLGYIF